MTDTEIESVILTLPSVAHRAKALAHLYQMQQQVKRLEAELAVPRLAPTAQNDTELQIVAWIRDTHRADTVRAQYARKLADKIAAGEYKNATSERTE